MNVVAIVLCGGTSARMGGSDKTAMDLGDRSVLGSVVASLPDDWTVVCVGQARPLPREVTWVREDPPLSGPVSGLAAGLAAAGDARIVVALAGDQPFAGPTAIACATALADADEGIDGVAARQADGRLQALLAAYRRTPFAAALDAAPDENAGVHRSLSGLNVVGLQGDHEATLDVDTPADLARARARVDPGTV